MASLDFPISPANNQIYTLNGVQYYYNGVIGAWLTNLITNPINANTVNTQILFNDAGYTNGSFGLVYNKYSNTFATGSIVATGNLSTTGSVTATGNVGIGITPTSPLHISNGLLVGDAVKVELGNNVKGYFGGHALNNGGFYINSNQSNQDLRLRTQGTDRVLIDANGNVGIGNTNPNLKLEVAGNMSVDAFIEYSSVITTNYTITSGRNALSAGPITLNTGVMVTVPVGSVWTVM